jgi:hypothetical protein
VIEAVFLIAIVAGGIAALAGNRAAIALLAGTAFTAGMTSAGVPFNMAWWMLVDLAVVSAIILGTHMGLREAAILALFFPLWGTYFVEGGVAWRVSALASAAQLLLTFPFDRVAESGRRLLQTIKRDGDGMARVIAWGA